MRRIVNKFVNFLTLLQTLTEKGQFYHLGMVYHTSGCQSVTGQKAEDDFCWVAIPELKQKELTPFAQHVAHHLRDAREQ